MQPSNLGSQAANASWFAPLLAILCNIVAITLQVERTVEIAIACVGFALILFGLCAAIFAFVSIKTYGYRKILLPAVVGFAFNAGIIYLLFDILLKMTRRA